MNHSRCRLVGWCVFLVKRTVLVKLTTQAAVRQMTRGVVTTDCTRLITASLLNRSFCFKNFVSFHGDCDDMLRFYRVAQKLRPLCFTARAFKTSCLVCVCFLAQQHFFMDISVNVIFISCENTATLYGTDNH